MTTGKTPRALVLLAQGTEEMELTITVDVLRRGGVEVVVAGLDGDGPTTCARKIRIVPDMALAAVSGHFDIVVLPGGADGAKRFAASSAVGRLLREREIAGDHVAAICAAPIAFAEHDVFRGRTMTCHPSVHDVVGAHGRLTTGAVVEDGTLVTSPGPGTAFEFALALVRRLVGDEKAREIRRPMLLD